MASAFRMKPPMHGLGIRASHPLATGLVGYWPLWEGSGDRAMDVTQNGRAGTLTNGPTWVSGPRGGALAFDRTEGDNEVGIGLLDMASWPGFTAAALVRYNGAAGAEHTIMSNFDTGNACCLVRIEPLNGAIEVFTYREASTVVIGSFTDIALVADTWAYIVVTYDSGPGLAAYKDGVASATTVAGGSILDSTNSTVPMTFGFRSGDALGGQISHTAIWSRALTASQVAELHADPWGLIRPPSTITTFTVAGMVPEKHPPPAAIRNYKMKPPMHGMGIRASHPLANGLVGYWPFWEGSGEVMDLVGGNTMLRQNSPTWTPSASGQAMLFDDGSSQYLETSSTCSISGYPFTLAAWVNPDAEINGAIISFGDNGASKRHELRLRDPGDTDVIALSGTAGVVFAKTSASYSTGSWQHAAGVWAGAADRSVYLNGGSKGTSAGNAIWDGGEDITQIAAVEDGNNPALFFSGMIALAAIWNRALSDAEVLELYQDPYALIRPPSTITTFAGLGGAVGNNVPQKYMHYARMRAG